MGCVSSRPVVVEGRNLFHVWNVDDRGNHLASGKIELTQSELILHQKGKLPIRWPLRSLRKYGFDVELFSFECGRRCPTGPGIYAFRCRHAEVLFNLLQESIQNNTVVEQAEDQVSGGTNASTNGSISSQQLPPVSSIEVDHVRSSAVPSSSSLIPSCSRSYDHSNSFTKSSNQTKCLLRQSLSENWSAGTNIANLICPSHHCSVGSCKRYSAPSPHYANGEIFVPDTHPSRSSFSGLVTRSLVKSEYSVVHDSYQRSSRSLALHTQHSHMNGTVTSLSCTGGTCVNKECNNNPCSCKHIDMNTNYTQLEELCKQEHTAAYENEHCYVNVGPEQIPVAQRQHVRTSGYGFSSSVYPRGFTGGSIASQISQEDNSRLYENIGQNCVKSCQTDGRQVNYIMLDLEQRSDSGCSISTPKSPPNSIKSPQSSPSDHPEGYATIDFDKTAALLNSAKPTVIIDDCIRKTRHNATEPCKGSNS
ncbi:uncharacterized protein LOC106473607 [Limulus polyphemus]|uniref:Uncharacterized protein LOC106473607 n=1 Tax=Limulus polyphemus TaxID=6850 RepID=A0ABM1BVZ6_LIMPO|nr:uncharacterized protein LOC106473607 [Limulus polyphemus]XP_022257711.1 uncharacterized protein LOC106473607 [Limulus polyphemus]